MTKRVSISIAFGVGALLLLGLWWQRGDVGVDSFRDGDLISNGDSVRRNDGPGGLALPTPTYVGGRTCVGCHQEQTDLWAGSHHDLAMQLATDQTVLGDFRDATFTSGGVTSFFSRQGDKFIARTEGPDGDLIDYEIAYTFGVSPLQQYLVAFPGGRYQALSIAWDSRPETEGGQRWFHLYENASATGGEIAISPQDPLHWTRPAQNWNTVCAECHSTNLSKGFDPDTRTFETTWTDMDVSCEACHGPASRHLEIAGGAAVDGVEGSFDWGILANTRHLGRAWEVLPGATTATPIDMADSALRTGQSSTRTGQPSTRTDPSPARTTLTYAQAQIETCAHCHSRRATLDDGPVPGNALFDSDLVSLLDEGLYHPDGQIQDEVYVYGSFVQSKMYRAGVTCSDCHEPHSLRLRAPGNALCTQCHVATNYDRPTHTFHRPESEGAQCVQCHMPETTYMAVDPRRDHSLRIPRPDLTATIGTPNACAACHENQSADWAADAIKGWYGETSIARASPHYGEILYAGRRGAPDAASALAELAGDTTVPSIARGTALSLLSRFPGTSHAPSVLRGLSDSEPFVRLGAIRAAEGLADGGITDLLLPLLDDPLKGIRVQAARLLAAVPSDDLNPNQSTGIEVAIAEYEEAQMTNADHPSSWVDLGNLYVARGRLAEAESAYQMALAVDSLWVPAHLNLADFRRAQGRDDLAAAVLHRALELLPNSPGLMHSQGLLYVRQGALNEALEWLERASTSSPENSRFGYVYGVALASADRVPEGIEVLIGTLARHPYQPDLLVALATYSRDIGRMDDAVGFAERLVEIAADDPGAQRLLGQLMNRP